MERIQNMRQSIMFRSISVMVFLLLLFSVIVSVFGYRAFTDILLEQFADGAFRVAHGAANYVNADRLDAYMADGGTSEEYRESWDKLDKLCNGANVTFIYVIQPDLTDYAYIHFVFSTVNHNTDYTPYEAGYIRKTTNEEYKMKYRALYEGTMDEALLFLQNKAFDKSEFHLTAMISLKGDDGQTKGILCVQRQTDVLEIVRRGYVRNIMTAMLILTASVIFWEGTALSRGILQPVRIITEEAIRFARENTPAEKKLTETIRKKDEIRVLADSIDTMEERIQSYVKDRMAYTAKEERMSAELDMAARIQSSRMPSVFPAFPDRNEFDIYAYMDPAREVGGDFYDFFLVDDDHLCLVMADVSGKGIPGALFMMISKFILQSNGRQNLSPAEILTRTNEAICDNNENEMFVTVWLGILEISTGRMAAANAGHEYPAIKRPDGCFELFKDKHGFVIGGMEGVKYKEYELLFEPGSKLFLYTDGVPEATDAQNRMFGTDRMLKALNVAPDASPKDLLKNVQKAVDAFVKDAEQFDDLTMMCMEYKGPTAV